MAVSYGFGQFSQRMALQAKLVGENAERKVRRAAIAADTALVLSTPFDTGRARGNWNVSTGRPDNRVTEDTDPTGGSSVNRGTQVIEAWELGGGTIYIANSLPYILALENGSSQQRPEGMTQHGLAAAREQLGKGKLLG